MTTEQNPKWLGNATKCLFEAFVEETYNLHVDELEKHGVTSEFTLESYKIQLLGKCNEAPIISFGVGRRSGNRNTTKKTEPGVKKTTTDKTNSSKADVIKKENGCCHILERGPNGGKYCNNRVTGSRKCCTRHKEHENKSSVTKVAKDQSVEKVANKRGRKRAVQEDDETVKPDASILPDAKNSIEDQPGASYLENYDESRGLYLLTEHGLIMHGSKNKMLAVAELDDNDKPSPISSKNEIIAQSYGIGNYDEFFGEEDGPKDPTDDNEESDKENLKPTENDTGFSIVSADMEHGMIAVGNMAGVAKAIENNKKKISTKIPTNTRRRKATNA